MWGPTLTMTWLAWTPTAAVEAMLHLEDQLRGAQLQGWVTGWSVQWTTWVEHTTYGVVFWVQPQGVADGTE